MSKLDIPDSWILTTLGEIGSTMIGLTYSPTDISNDGIPVLRSGNIQKGKIDLNDLVRVRKDVRPQLIVNSGDILICARNGSRALVGKAAQINSLPERMTFGAFMAIYRSQFNDYIEKFLNSPSFRKLVEGVGTSTINQITQSNLKGIALPLPPLAEQKRIVAKIESTQEKIKTIEQSVTKAEELIGKYREALLQKAFRGELVPQDPNDEPASKLLERIRADRAKQTEGKKKKKDDLLPIKPEEIPFEIPNSWVWVRLGELIEIRSGGTPKDLPTTSDGSDIQFVKVADMNESSDGKFIDSVTLSLSQRTAERLGIATLPSGTIIFPKRGGAILTNKKRLLNNAAAVDTNIMGIIPPNELGRYIWFWFSSIDLGRLHTGSSIPQINNGDIAPLLVPIPPKEEAEKIIAKFEKSHGKFDAGLKEILLSIERLRSAILQQAFSGHLVPQDPAEGTGHELLEKIRSETSLLSTPPPPSAKPKRKKQAKS